MRRGRPFKPRLIDKEPKTKRFSPRGTAGRPGHITLSLDEYESIRYADHVGLAQYEAARSMGISQQTFSRVLTKARRRIAEGLVLGRIIRIAGGSYKISHNS